MLKAVFSKPYSCLSIVGDNSGWSTDIDAIDLERTARRLGIKAQRVKRVYWNIPQVVHYTSQFSLMIDGIYKNRHRISVDYYHGKPDQQESFRQCFEALQRHHQDISRVRVSTREMGGLIKSSGIDSDKVMRIPIGVDTELFTPQTESKRVAMREKLGIPQDAVIIGSFQKDGVGWGEGNEPKLIKGPDVFIEVISRLKREMPNLWVLLSGPARGYMRNELEKLDVPYRHEFLKDFKKLPELYDAIDLYIVASREEGGPKAILESMAKGVPLVTTAVGQAVDLVKSVENGIMVPINDVEGLYRAALQALDKRGFLIEQGLRTAKENSFEYQLPLWKEYFEPMMKHGL